MSFLKDSKYVKTIAFSLNFKELTDDSCRFILSEVELVLRDIVINAAKYSFKFKKNNLST